MSLESFIIEEESSDIVMPSLIALDVSSIIVELVSIMTEESSDIALLVASVSGFTEAVLLLQAARARRETETAPRRTLFIQNMGKKKKEPTL